MIRPAAALLLALALPAAARDRAVPREFQRLNPCPSTGRPTGACPGWVRDHVVPLCAGGADSLANMQWQTVEEARRKDREERRECRAPRSGSPLPRHALDLHPRAASASAASFRALDAELPK